MTAMMKQKEIIVYAVSMILKAALLAASWAGKKRERGLKLIANMPIDEKDKEITFLRDRVYQLETRIKIFQKQIQSHSNKTRYTLKERLFILWHMEYFQIPRRQVTKTFGIARSTFYHWLKNIDDIPLGARTLTRAVHPKSGFFHYFLGKRSNHSCFV